MTMLPAAFQSDDHEDMGNFDPIPLDSVNVQIVASEMKPTKKAIEAKDPESGQRLVLEAEVIDGEYKGRKLFIGLNMVNPNPKAVEISQKELATICRACGKVTIEDSAELHNIPFVAKIGIKPGDGAYAAQQTYKGYEKYDGPIEASSGGVSEAKAAPKKKSGNKKWD